MNVGAQRPTKIPNLSEWACISGVFPPVRYQIAIDAAIDKKPRTKQIKLRNLN